MRKGVIAVIALSLAMPLLFLGPASRAFAASCYASTCTGKSPETEGCSADAYTAEQVAIDNSKGVEVGYLQLRYSPTCRSTWGKVFSAQWAQDQDWVMIENAQDNMSLRESCYAPESPTVPGSYPYECMTTMIDDLNPLTSQSVGTVWYNGQLFSNITNPPF